MEAAAKERLEAARVKTFLVKVKGVGKNAQRILHGEVGTVDLAEGQDDGGQPMCNPLSYKAIKGSVMGTVPVLVQSKMKMWAESQGHMDCYVHETTMQGKSMMFAMWVAVSCLRGRMVMSEDDFDECDLRNVRKLGEGRFRVVPADHADSDHAVHEVQQRFDELSKER